MRKLQTLLERQVETTRDTVKLLKKCKKPVDEIKVKHVLGGLRGVKVINWNSTMLDPMKGYVVRGIPLEEMVVRLPRDGMAPIPESMFWYLLTGTVPKPDVLASFQADIYDHSTIPPATTSLLASLPASLPPLSKLCIGLMSLQPNSAFRRSYGEKTPRGELWKGALEDAVSILAKLPGMVAMAYANRAPPEYSDYAETTAEGISGKKDGRFSDLLSYLFVVLSDGDGGSVSAHVSKAVSSTLSDPFISLSSAFCGIAGPRHAGAAQHCLEWLQELHEKLGRRPDDQAIAEEIMRQMRGKRLIPGFGHAVLKVEDPRFRIITEYVQSTAPSDDLLNLVQKLRFIGTECLKKSGIRNPTPNVDLALAVALHAMGAKDGALYPIVFALGRSLGILSNLVWDRALEIPIEYAISMDIDDIEALEVKQEK